MILLFYHMEKKHIDRYGNPLGTPPLYKDLYNYPIMYEDKEFKYEENELPLFVNVNQYGSIKKRKARRDFLDMTMKKNHNCYLHESRHKHAMNRLRAPSGRFLTKEETEALKKKEETYK
ncbi:CCAAT-binding transcription factor [Spraguea lophii 42_110]|uniref:Transcriptional activator HAP2 n=1 Tax=Spraguea lophii (strain 42_110) TaxID=1358809 RepID=S7XVV9_SPRLO|nr:CCAAT-binding transcription factor [Spraguea lophii 42_110]